MGIKHYTALGELIDMGALVAKHSNTVALGNARMNARGDVVGQGGIVLKTQEQIEEEWQRARQMENVIEQPMDLKTANIPMPHAPKKIVADDADFAPEPAPVIQSATADAPSQVQATATSTASRRRKIVDSAE